jgi:hypothetical protein
MALIVEDGTGKADAESYISVADASTYHTARGNAAWAALASDTVREQCLRRATDYMEQVYRKRWAGTRKTTTQALSWPRSFVPREDYEYAGLNGYTVIGGNYYYPDDEVPQEVKNACAELALKASTDTLAPDIEQRVKREKVGPLEVEYADYSPAFTQYRAIDNMLSPFLKAGGSASMVGLVRT